MKKLYYNGNIITMNSNLDEVNSIIIEDGKILEVGMDLKLEDGETIDLDGKTLLPGFIDGHSHFAVASQFATFPTIANPPVGPIESIEDIITTMKKQLKDELAEDPDTKIIFALGYDHELLKEHRHPNKFDLDKISTEIGVVAIHASAHVGGVNSKVLEMLGYDENSEDPAGGRIGRVEGTTEPNGFLEENAFILNFFKLLPHPDDEVLQKQADAGVQLYASNGITTVQDGYPGNSDFLFYQFVDKNKALPFDIFAYPGAVDPNKWDDGTFGVKFGDMVGRMKYAGGKIFTDGSPQARTAWLTEPYEVVEEGDDPNYKGYPRYTNEQVEQGIRHCLENNAQFICHVNGDAGLDQMLDSFEKVKKEFPGVDVRPVAIHTQIAREDQFVKMKELGVMPSFFVAHTFYWGDVHRRNLGEERAGNISWIPKAIENGLPFTCHEDSPVVPPRILFSIWAGVNRKTRSGFVLGPENRVSVYEMLKAYTSHGAYAYFEEDKRGTLEEGKVSDLVILDRNPLTVDPDDIKDIKVVETIKEGKTIYKAN